MECQSVLSHSQAFPAALLVKFPSPRDVSVGSVLSTVDKNISRLYRRCGKFHCELHETGNRLLLYSDSPDTLRQAELELHSIFPGLCLEFSQLDTGGSRFFGGGESGSRIFSCGFIGNTVSTPSNNNHVAKQIIDEIMQIVCGRSYFVTPSSRYLPDLLSILSTLPRETRKFIRFGSLSSGSGAGAGSKEKSAAMQSVGSPDSSTSFISDGYFSLPTGCSPSDFLRQLVSSTDDMKISHSLFYEVHLDLDGEDLVLDFRKLSDDCLECWRVRHHFTTLDEFFLAHPDYTLDYALSHHTIFEYDPESSDPKCELIKRIIPRIKYLKGNVLIPPRLKPFVREIFSMEKYHVEVAASGLTLELFYKTSLSKPVGNGSYRDKGSLSHTKWNLHLVITDASYEDAFRISDTIVIRYDKFHRVAAYY